MSRPVALGSYMQYICRWDSSTCWRPWEVNLSVPRSAWLPVQVALVKSRSNNLWLALCWAILKHSGLYFAFSAGYTAPTAYLRP